MLLSSVNEEPSTEEEGENRYRGATHGPAFCPSWRKSPRGEKSPDTWHTAGVAVHLSGGSSPFLLGPEPVTDLGAGHSFGGGAQETGRHEGEGRRDE